ncbi:MAG: threonine--tRNA ligase [Armatimonadetes bacterium]|nr:threonine--tRNA ligase [Armatimonadota bacterium]
MAQITITLPDGSTMQVPACTTAAEIAEEIGPALARDAVAAQINGQTVDLSTPIDSDAELTILTVDSPEGLRIYRHSAAHVMADAVVRLFPEAKPTIGPPIEDGFYYDFAVEEPFSEEDLARIEVEMEQIIAADLPFTRQEVSPAEARAHFEQTDNPYKVELIEELVEEGEQKISLYQHGDFVDLCRGPHLPATGEITAFKLLSVAGAYWRGDESNPMLQRIYGTAYPDQKMLEEHLKRIVEAKEHDHRKLGRELKLFSFFEEAGAGLVYYHPNGAMLRQLVTDFTIKEHIKRGYELVRTPHLIKSTIWEISGHAQQDYPMYYTDVEGQSYGIKPMNCPGHILIYNSETRSYRDLPIRYFELGTVYRHERSGVLHGLLRVRGFTQDDAHIFCTPEQLTDEIVGVIKFAQDMLSTFGFEEYEVLLATKPDKAMGTDEMWEQSTQALASALERCGLPYHEAPKEGIFYGPKIDIALKDALGRLWDGPTIQCDFNMPERFDITYVGPDGQEHRPVMVHRVVLAGIERFLGALIENCAGNFPLWLAPVQIRILPITDRNVPYADEIAERLREEDLRVEVDGESATLQAKIRDAELMKIPYMLVVGDREQQSGQVAVRSREEGDLGPQPLEEFIEQLKKESAHGAENK